MARQLVQKLYLHDLPPGLKMTVTDVQTTFFANLEDQYPMTVSPSRKEGLIGEVKFDACVGNGGNLYIAIHIEGTFEDVRRKSYNIDERGYITVSASDWKPIERPDFTKISYDCGDAAPTILSIRVPEVGEPMDAMFSFSVGANGNHMLISGRGNS